MPLQLPDLSGETTSLLHGGAANDFAKQRSAANVEVGNADANRQIETAKLGADVTRTGIEAGQGQQKIDLAQKEMITMDDNIIHGLEASGEYVAGSLSGFKGKKLTPAAFATLAIGAGRRGIEITKTGIEKDAETEKTRHNKTQEEIEREKLKHQGQPKPETEASYLSKITAAQRALDASTKGIDTGFHVTGGAQAKADATVSNQKRAQQAYDAIVAEAKSKFPNIQIPNAGGSGSGADTPPKPGFVKIKASDSSIHWVPSLEEAKKIDPGATVAQ